MWSPIVDGERADRITRTVREIAAAVGSHEPSLDELADLAVFWSYVASHFDDDEVIAAHHARALERLAELRPTTHALYGGMAGLGWVAAHVTDDAGELLNIVDASLARTLDVACWDRDYDLIGGLVGIGVYLLERQSPLLTRVLDHLEATCVRIGDAIAWFTTAQLMPPNQRGLWPDGHFNCGLAHGVPGVLALLARIVEQTGDPRAADLGRGAARWIWEQRLPASAASAFPGIASGPASRTAWCYGDPGVTLALWRAERAFGSREDEALELAAAWLRRSVDVNDADLCHGSTGLAQIAARMFHATADPRFRDAAIRWLDHAESQRVAGAGLAGYRTHLVVGPTRWRTSARFLDGVAGVGLALLAAISPIEPAWDRLLLCDLMGTTARTTPLLRLDGAGTVAACP